MPIEIESVRADTPGCAQVIHLNNAGASLPPQPVLDATIEYLEAEALVGGYELAADRAAEHEAVYESIAGFIGASAAEIALTDSATRAWDAVFYAMGFEPGDRIVTTTTEYASNYLAYLQAVERHEVAIDIAPDTADGEVDVTGLEAMLDRRTRLISMNHVPTNSGLVNPVAEVGRVARAAGIPFLLDACQSVGQLPIDVGEIGCDYLTATSRKFLRGPRGVGFLYVSREADLQPFVIDLHSATWSERSRYETRRDARRFELWESNIAIRLGLGAAVDYAARIGVADIWERVAVLAARLRMQLETIPGVEVRDVGRVKGAIVTFDVDGRAATDLRDELRRHGINVSVATPASARIDMEARSLGDLVRASVHYFNTEAELDTFCETLARLVR